MVFHEMLGEQVVVDELLREDVIAAELHGQHRGAAGDGAEQHDLHVQSPGGAGAV